MVSVFSSEQKTVVLELEKGRKEEWKDFYVTDSSI